MSFDVIQEAASVAATFPDLKATIVRNCMEITRTNCDYKSPGGTVIKCPLRLIISTDRQISVEIFLQKFLTVHSPSEQKTAEMVKSISFYGIRHVICPGVEFIKPPRTSCQAYTSPYVHYRSSKCSFWLNVFERRHGRRSAVPYGKCKACQAVCRAERDLRKKNAKAAAARASANFELDDGEDGVQSEEMMPSVKTSKKKIRLKGSLKDGKATNTFPLESQDKESTNPPLLKNRKKRTNAAKSDRADQLRASSNQKQKNHIIDAENLLRSEPVVVENTLAQLTTDTESRTFKCTICSDSFTSRDDYETHTRIHNVLSRSLCKERFNDSLTLGNHKQLHHSVHTCSLCEKQFRDNLALVNHVRLDHSKKRFRCRVCPLTFSTLEARSTHAESHLGSSPLHGPFYCEMCGLAVEHESTLKYHMSKHTGKRRFECSLCEKGFSVKRSLGAHMENGCGSDDAFTCTNCGKGCTSSRSLKHHLWFCKKDHRISSPIDATSDSDTLSPIKGGRSSVAIDSVGPSLVKQELIEDDVDLVTKLQSNQKDQSPLAMVWVKEEPTAHLEGVDGVSDEPDLVLAQFVDCSENVDVKMEWTSDNQNLWKDSFGDEASDSCSEVDDTVMENPAESSTFDPVRHNFICHVCASEFASLTLLEGHCEMHRSNRVRLPKWGQEEKKIISTMRTYTTRKTARRELSGLSLGDIAVQKKIRRKCTGRESSQMGAMSGSMELTVDPASDGFMSERTSALQAVSTFSDRQVSKEETAVVSTKVVLRSEETADIDSPVMSAKIGSTELSLADKAT